MRILGIETSCDESAVCLIDAEGSFGSDFQFKVLGNSLNSQIAIHAQYGGVFPNLAKREHAKNLVPLLEQTLSEAGMSLDTYTDISAYADKLREILAREPELYTQLLDFFSKNTKREHSNILQNVGMLQKPEIDAIAVTVGPGLEPALWVGINFARALSLVWNIPIVAVNHMEGHFVSALLRDDEGFRFQVSGNSEINTKTYNLEPITYPLLALLISGGHTELVLSSKLHDYKILGATRDDAVGEAFDKVARLLGLPYPGGAELSALAERARKSHEMSSQSIEMTSHWMLPRPMLHDKTLDFSFAGLKTAVLRLVEAEGSRRSDLPGRSDLLEFRMQIAREFEDAVTEVLVAKTMKAVDEYGVQTVVVGGGVSANGFIKSRIAEALEKAGLPRPLVPSRELATDNAIMIALAGYFRAKNRDFVNPDMLKANGNLKLA
ncbi:MAG: tRNA (adenosine(37)-N6)-threonylcarbamoyltransferase complex transferase subunit TsaD [bacterium]|nr:tRNA (adenosine(37)-N6)-threonylcarbamoyltransferase complex transferase subunit TsaD [bacterium]